MVIDANKDAARECVLRAKDAMKNNDIARMQKLLQKAKKLDPNCDVSSILKNGHVPNREYTANNSNSTAADAEDETDNSYSHDDYYNSFDETEVLRNRKSKARSDSPGPSHSGGRANRSPARNSSSTKADPRPRSKSAARSPSYTTEDTAQVERIRHCKDYYELLQITKTEFSEVLLKKKYRELALKLHPDKCKAPGATEAFKALGNAYAILSDPKKREDYDRFGSEEQQATRRTTRYRSDFYDYDINRGFEAEMSPEDIFEMFFGGAFPSSSMHRRRTHYHFRRQENFQQREEPSLFYQLLQILPIIVILIGGLLVQFFSSEPPYSLTYDSTFNVLRYTRDLRVPYYVKPDFEASYRGKVPQVEHHVENDYLAMLRTNCYREKSNRESLLWTARIRGDSELWKRAQEMELTNCRKLEDLYR